MNANLAFTSGEIMREMEYVEFIPAPDIILGIPPMDILFGIAKYTDYTLVYHNKSGVIWKGIPGYGNSYLYVRNELVPYN